MAPTGKDASLEFLGPLGPLYKFSHIKVLPEPHGDLSSMAEWVSGLSQTSSLLLITTVLVLVIPEPEVHT